MAGESWSRRILVVVAVALIALYVVAYLLSVSNPSSVLRPTSDLLTVFLVGCMLLFVAAIGPPLVGRLQLKLPGISADVQGPSPALQDAPSGSKPPAPDEVAKVTAAIDRVHDQWPKVEAEVIRHAVNQASYMLGLTDEQIRWNQLLPPPVWPASKLTRADPNIAQAIVLKGGMTHVFEVVGLVQFVLRDRLFIRDQESLGSFAPGKCRFVILCAKWWQGHDHDKAWESSYSQLRDYFSDSSSADYLCVIPIDVSEKIRC